MTFLSAVRQKRIKDAKVVGKIGNGCSLNKQDVAKNHFTPYSLPLITNGT